MLSKYKIVSVLKNKKIIFGLRKVTVFANKKLFKTICKYRNHVSLFASFIMWTFKN